MSNTNGTTSAPSSASPTPTLDELEAILNLDLVDEPVRRRRVVHIYWTKLDGPTYLCGRQRTSAGRDDDPRVQIVGGLMPLPWYDDCKTCLRALEAAHRRGRIRA